MYEQQLPDEVVTGEGVGAGVGPAIGGTGVCGAGVGDATGVLVLVVCGAAVGPATGGTGACVSGVGLLPPPANGSAHRSGMLTGQVFPLSAQHGRSANSAGQLTSSY